MGLTAGSIGGLMVDGDLYAGTVSRLMTAEDIAAVLRITKRTLLRYVSSGQFPKADIRRGPKFVRWLPATVGAWIGGSGESMTAAA